jgi:hypothetical protein
MHKCRCKAKRLREETRKNTRGKRYKNAEEKATKYKRKNLQN